MHRAEAHMHQYKTHIFTLPELLNFFSICLEKGMQIEISPGEESDKKTSPPNYYQCY